MEIIDTHQHLICPDRFGYAWCKNLPEFEGKTFGLEEYRAAADDTGIRRTLFMETDVDEPDIRAETEFALALADDAASGVVGVIAACRPEAADFAARIEPLLLPNLKGFRRVLHTQPDELSQTPLFVENLSRLAGCNRTFDLCLLGRQLPLGETLLRRLPEVQFVLDHCGIPNIRDNALDPWHDHIRGLARYPNLACKISGVVAYADPQCLSADILRPYVEHCIECFGWDRVLFGGDWPVCNLTSNLGRWVAIAKELLNAESQERQEKFFVRNAERIYHCAKH